MVACQTMSQLASSSEFKSADDPFGGLVVLSQFPMNIEQWQPISKVARLVLANTRHCGLTATHAGGRVVERSAEQQRALQSQFHAHQGATNGSATKFLTFLPLSAASKSPPQASAGR